MFTFVHIFRIKFEEFNLLAENICVVFPTEVPTTYYLKASEGRRARGKLYDAYNNYRNFLAKSGVITRRAVKSKVVPLTTILGNYFQHLY